MRLAQDPSRRGSGCKPDNLGIDRHGNLLIQEDPGGDPHDDVYNGD